MTILSVDSFEAFVIKLREFLASVVSIIIFLLFGHPFDWIEANTHHVSNGI